MKIINWFFGSSIKIPTCTFGFITWLSFIEVTFALFSPTFGLCINWACPYLWTISKIHGTLWPITKLTPFAINWNLDVSYYLEVIWEWNVFEQVIKAFHWYATYFYRHHQCIFLPCWNVCNPLRKSFWITLRLWIYSEQKLLLLAWRRSALGSFRSIRYQEILLLTFLTHCLLQLSICEILCQKLIFLS